MKIERIIERYHCDSGTVWTVQYTGCKSANNGHRTDTFRALPKTLLKLVLETKPSERINFPDGSIKWIYEFAE